MGYSRVFDKTAGDRIDAEDFNNEYEALTSAFNPTGGHTHDGTVDNGALVPVISDADRHTYVEVNGASKEIALSIESGTAAEIQMYLRDGVLTPRLNADVDLGTGTERFNTIFGQHTHTNNLSLATGVSVSSIQDEDDLASNSPFALATQQSIKQYVDNTIDASPGVFAKVEVASRTSDQALTGALANYITTTFDVDNDGSYVLAIGTATAKGEITAGAVFARIYEGANPVGTADNYVTQHSIDGEEFHGSTTMTARVGPLLAGTYTFSLKMREQATTGTAEHATLILMEETA